MFQLIVTLLAIALGAAAAVAAVYYGGSAFETAGVQAQAAKIVNSGQQLSGWVRLERADKPAWNWFGDWLNPRGLPRKMGFKPIFFSPPGSAAPASSDAGTDLVLSGFWADGFGSTPIATPPCGVSLATGSGRGLRVVTPICSFPYMAAMAAPAAEISTSWKPPAGETRVLVGGHLAVPLCRAVNQRALGLTRGSATSGGNRIYGCDTNQVFYYAIGG